MGGFQNIVRLIFLFACLGCGASKKTTTVFEGTYTYRKIFPGGIQDECKITLLKNNTFKYGCTYHHFGTVVSGTWKLVRNKKIIINIQEEDILSTYPEIFYNKIDTIYVLTDTSIMSKGKIFLFDRNL
jgi:hypothetical protein